MSVKLELKADQLIKDFDRLTGEVQQAMIDELRVTGFMIESAYKIGVPVDTGRLRSSIHTEHSDQTSFSYSDSKGNTFNGSLGYKLERTQVIVGTNVEYANVIENGFSGSVNIPTHSRTNKFGTTFSVSSHSRQMTRRGNSALQKAFEAETKGLPQRLAELIK